MTNSTDKPHPIGLTKTLQLSKFEAQALQSTLRSLLQADGDGSVQSALRRIHRKLREVTND